MPQATSTDTTQDPDSETADTPRSTSITVHHLDREKCNSPEDYADKIADFNRERWSITQDTFDSLYTPVETVLNENDIEAGFKRSQGFRVNELCNARHGVRSSQVNDVLEVIRPDGESKFYAIDSMGFTEVSLTG